MFKNPKGTYGYITKQRKIELLKTIILFGISAALYIIGYVTTHSNKNILTIIAVLGCLPASKNAVELIMFFKAKGCSNQLYEKLSTVTSDLPCLYDLYLTSYSNNYQISHCIYKSKTLLCITENTELNQNLCSEHIVNILRKNGYKDITVKVFDSSDKYIERIQQLMQLSDESKDITNDILELMKSISL